MSVLMQLATEVVSQVPPAPAPGPVSGGGGGGIKQWIEFQSGEVRASMLAIAGAAILTLCVFAIIKAKASPAASIIALVVAGVLGWGIYNIQSISDATGDQVQLAPASVVTLEGGGDDGV